MEGKNRKKNLPDKAALIEEINLWKWRYMQASQETQPWLSVPGLVVYLDTQDTDFESRLEMLALAVKRLKRK
jgi:hypothetical protein